MYIMSRRNRNRITPTAALIPSIPSIKPPSIPSSNSSVFRSSGYSITDSEKNIYKQLTLPEITAVKTYIETDRNAHDDTNTYSNSIIKKIFRRPTHRVYVAYIVASIDESGVEEKPYTARGIASFRGNVIELKFYSDGDEFIDEHYIIKFDIEKYKKRYGEYPNFIFFEEEASKLKKPSPQKRKTVKQQVSDFFRKTRKTPKFHSIVPV